MVQQCGGEAQFKQAVEIGEVEQIESEDGRIFYAYRELKAGTKRATKATVAVSRAAAVDKEGYEKLSQALDSLGWSFQLTKKQEAIAAETGEVPAIAYQKMTDALAGTGTV